MPELLHAIMEASSVFASYFFLAIRTTIPKETAAIKAPDDPIITPTPIATANPRPPKINRSQPIPRNSGINPHPRPTRPPIRAASPIGSLDISDPFTSNENWKLKRTVDATRHHRFTGISLLGTTPGTSDQSRTAMNRHLRKVRKRR